MVRGIVDPLAEAHISVHDVITSATSVAVFVEWGDRERALGIIQQEF
jgi:aspartate kinase